MAESDDNKTEQPTARHVSDAFDEGRFAKSPELSVVIMLSTAVGLLAFTGQGAAESVARFSAEIFTNFGTMSVRTDTVTSLLMSLVTVVGGILVPVVGGCMAASLLAGGLQSGFQLTPKVLGLHLEVLDISNGFSRVFSKSKLVHTAIDAGKLVAVGAALWVGTRTLIKDPIFTAPVETAYLAEFLGHATTAFLSRMIFSLGAIAALSYAYERFKTSKELMMTKQEVKDESRNAEGNSMVKAARRRMARRLLQTQMLAAVATADVVVTNPTHYAVALKYERGKDRAPVVLAKGENRFALRIKEIAAENGVPMVEDRPVARMLYALGRVGEPIPTEVYQAVARILAVVYRTHRYYFHRLKSRRLEQTA